MLSFSAGSSMTHPTTRKTSSRPPALWSRSTTRSPRSRTRRRCSSIRPAILRACRIPRSSSSSRMSSARSSFSGRRRTSPSRSGRSTKRSSSDTAMFRFRRPTPSLSPMRVRAGRTRSAACRTRCACRRGRSAISTATAPRWPRLSARVRVRPAHCRRRRPATSFSHSSRSSSPT